MLQIPIEGSRIQMGAYLLRVVQERKRPAVLRGTAVAHLEYVRDKAEAIGFERAAQR